MTAFVHDTHSQVKHLIASGMDEIQAEAIVTIVQDVRQSEFGHLATKEDLARTEGSIREDMARMEGNLREDMVRITGGLREDMTRMGGGLKEDMARMEGTLRSDFLKALLTTTMAQTTLIIGSVFAIVKIFSH